MSAVCILAPVVIATWPAFSSAVVAAATSMGFQVAAEATSNLSRGTSASVAKDNANSIQLEIDRSEVVTNQLGRDQSILVTKDGVNIRFSRDARGKASLCVTGNGRSQDELRVLGEGLSQTVVQQYVYQKLMDEMRSKGFNVVEEEVSDDRSIRLKVRHWDN